MYYVDMDYNWNESNIMASPKEVTALRSAHVWDHMSYCDLIFPLHGPRMEVTLKAQYKERADPAVLTLT